MNIYELYRHYSKVDGIKQQQFKFEKHTKYKCQIVFAAVM